MIVKFTIVFIIALLNIILGVVIYKKNTKSKSNIYYTLMCITGGLWAIFMSWLLIERNLYVLENFVIKGIYIFGTLPPLFYLLFAYNFPYKLKVYSKRVISLIYFIPAVFILLILFGFFKMESVVIIDNILNQKSVHLDYTCFTLYFFTYILWGLVILVRKIKRDPGSYKNQIRYLIIATIGTFITTGFVSVILPLFNNFTYDWLSPLFLLIHFGVAGYLIFYYPKKQK